MDWLAPNSLIFVKFVCVYVCSYKVWFRHSFRQRYLCLCLQLPSVAPTIVSSKVSVFVLAATKFGSDIHFVKGFCVSVCSYQIWFRHLFPSKVCVFMLAATNFGPEINFVKGFCFSVCSYQVWFRQQFRQRFLCVCFQLHNSDWTNVK